MEINEKSNNANLYRVILPVYDIEMAVNFYKRVLKMPGSRVSNGRHYFKAGTTILACYDPEADGDELGNGWHFHEHQYIYIAVADLESTFDLVRQHEECDAEEITLMPWGERLFYAKDPSGNPICFVDEETVFIGLD